VTVGGSFQGTAATQLTVTTAQPAFVGYSTAATGTSDGVRGEGYSPDGIGVSGIARATSGSATGVRGDTFSPDGIGVLGFGGSRGVYGYSPKQYGRGVYGYAYSSVAGQPIGVYGETGHATGIGVLGKNGLGGTGMRGETTSGIGVQGVASNAAGYALRGSGRVRFDKVSGLATLAAGTKSKTITPGTDVTTASFVLLTPMADIGTRRLWFARDTAANTIKIHMSSSRTSSTKIAWLMLG
jgi:hypothetical protein